VETKTTASPLTAPAASTAFLHALIVGVLTAVYAQVAMAALVFALFANAVALICLVVAVPLLYLFGLAFISRATTGRFRWWWSIVITATLCGLATVLGTVDNTIPGIGPLPAPALIIGVAAGLASLAALPRIWRVVGIVAIAAQLAVIAAPLVSAQIRQAEEQSAEDAAELQRLSDVNTRPYVVPGYVVRIVTPSDYETDVKFSSDPKASTRDDYAPEPSDYTISTSPLTAGQSAESLACRWILNPDLGGSASNSCEQIDADTWSLVSGEKPSLVRIQEGSRIEVSGGEGKLSEFTAMLDDAELMSDDDYDAWNLWIFERNKRA
jgi:hypothetical protein